MIIETNTGIKIDLDQFKNAGYGEFGKYVRKHIDPQWGKPPPEKGQKHKFEVKLTGTATVEVETYVCVECETEGEAKELAVKNVHSGDWDKTYCGIDDVDDVEVDEIEQIDEEE